MVNPSSQSGPAPPTSANTIHSFPAPSLFKSSTLVFSLNSTKIVLENPDPEVTLLDFVRAQGFTGTKNGCSEGGCGACTVVIGAMPHPSIGELDTTADREPQRPRYRSVNACLTPLIAVHGCHVLTVEGIGSTEKPHPVQERIAKMFGSQCGFCTPGIVMSLYATVRNGYGTEGLTEKAIEQSLDGNLCRCTGYRPILDAAKTFATDAQLGSNVTILEETDSDSSASPERVQTPPTETYPLPVDRLATAIPTEEKAPGEIGLAEGLQKSVLDMEDLPKKQAGCGKGGDCCMVKGGGGGGGCGGGESDDKPKTIPGIPTFTFKPYNPTAEPLFPPYLRKAAHLRTQDLILVKQNKDVMLNETSSLGNVWLRPGSLGSLLETMKMYPGAKIRSGNTETGIEVKFKASRFAVSVYVSDHLKDLATFSATEEGMTVGAAFPLSDLIAACKQQKVVHKDKQERIMLFDAILHNLKHFAGTQVRNVATLAGNITTASPISDLNPVWVSCGAILNYIDPSASVEPEKEKSVAMRDFFIAYRKVRLPRGAVVTSLFVPYPKLEAGEMVFTKAYKQSKRKDDDIAIVTCCLSARTSGNEIKEIHLVYGGMAPKTVESKDTQAYLTGKQWGDDGAFVEAMERLSTVDFALPFGVPGGMAVYRKSLTLSFFARFWAEVGMMLQVKVDSKLSSHLAELAGADITRNVSRGYQDLADVDLAKPVGQNKMHLSAMKQCTGEAQYVDDILHKNGELHGAIVFSTKPHAKIRGIDTTTALDMEGVAGFISVKDLAGSNSWNPPAMDDFLFADGEVHSTGQIIGMVCADTKSNAQAAARAVIVDYEELPYILTIDEAIAQESFFPPRPILRKGDISKLEEESDHVLEGTWRMGGQEQFYLESQQSAAHCVEDVIHVTASTQNPTETQVFVAAAMGVPQNRVVVRVVRLGGGFGGKETRSIPYSVAAAVASKKLRRPVRIILDRDEDMISSGARHGFMTKYRIGFKSTGKLVGIDVQIYNNGGWSQDLSQAVLERAMTHQDNCYEIPHVQVRGQICRTNTVSNTAFRGFGGPQGLFSMESMIELVAAKVGKPADVVRELNFYKEGATTHFGQTLQDWNVPVLWQQIKESSDFDRRRAEVDAFNAKNTWRKRGIQAVPAKFGISFTAKFLNQATASINIYQHDGSVLISHGGTEMGQGLHSKMIAVAAQELGTDHENCHIMETNTMVVSNTSATAASASSDLNAMAIKHACDQINARLAPYREKMPNATWKELTHAAYFDRVQLSAMGFYRTPEIGFDWEKASRGDTTGSRPFFYFTQGVAVSEVEVDTLTGDWSIIRSDVHMDIGRSINPAIDVGQIEGAFTQGFGLHTMEELLWLPNGTMFTRGPGAYKIPSFLDTPQDMRISFLKAEHAKTAHLRTYQGSKGIGEPPLSLGSSVFFAIKDALNSARKDNNYKVDEPWMLESPATPERIRLAAGDAIAAMAQKNCQPKEGEKDFFVRIEY